MSILLLLHFVVLFDDSKASQKTHHREVLQLFNSNPSSLINCPPIHGQYLYCLTWGILFVGTDWTVIGHKNSKDDKVLTKPWLKRLPVWRFGEGLRLELSGARSMEGAAVGIALQENTAPTHPKLPHVLPAGRAIWDLEKEGVWMEAAWNTWGSWSGVGGALVVLPSCVSRAAGCNTPRPSPTAMRVLAPSTWVLPVGVLCVCMGAWSSSNTIFDQTIYFSPPLESSHSSLGCSHDGCESLITHSPPSHHFTHSGNKTDLRGFRQ